MRSLLNIILLNRFIIKLRNLINLRPVPIDTISYSSKYSLSDAFIWRTDSSYVTIFKFTNISKIYFSVESSLEIIFFSNNGSVIKKHSLKMSKLSSQLIIDKDFMNGVCGYGYFLVFSNFSQMIKSTIRNSYYAGYSYKGSPFSLIHGNLPIAAKKFNNDKISMNILGFSFKKLSYVIQFNYDNSFDYSELFIINPSHRKIRFTVNNIDYRLGAASCMLLDITNFKKVIIRSNFYFFRPMTINYKNNYIDVFHN
tara:strand:- start:168 stop:929 length:762 start_codon:yes stop_codon:yes gene_type:complete